MQKRVVGAAAIGTRTWLAGAFVAAAGLALMLVWPNPANSTAELGALNADQAATMDQQTAASVDRGRKIYWDTAG